MKKLMSGLMICFLVMTAHTIAAEETSNRSLFAPGTTDVTKPLLVSVRPAPPFIIKDPKTGKIEGYSVDLMNGLVKELDPPRKVKYSYDPDISTQLKNIAEKNVDLGIAATTITAKREQFLDFSHPFMFAQLALMAPLQSEPGVWEIAKNFMTPELIRFFFYILLFIIASAHLIWLTERTTDRKKERREGLFHNDYFPGVTQGIWWTIVTMSTVGYGDFVPRKKAGRFLAIIIIMAGITVFGILISTLTSTLTVSNLKSGIESLEDLKDKAVGVIRDTNTAEIVETRNVPKFEVSGMEELIRSLEEGRVAAIIHDEPILKYYLYNKMDSSKFKLIPQSLDISSYGIVFPADSPLREQFNIALLKLTETKDSAYYQAEKKWFSER